MSQQPTERDPDAASAVAPMASAAATTAATTASGPAAPLQLPANVVLLRGRGPSGRVGPIGQTDLDEDTVTAQILEAAQSPLEAYRQQLFRAARQAHAGSAIVDWWHAGQARRAIDAACIQFSRLSPLAQRRVLAALPGTTPRLVASQVKAGSRRKP